MCNLYKLKRAVAEIADTFRALQQPLSLRFPEGVPNIEPRDEIRITDLAPIVRPDGEGAGLVQWRWSWPGPGGAPVFNFRAEGRRFPAASRCAVPVDGFYEFTAPSEPGAKRKDRWLFTMAGQGLFFIAGHVRGEAWTMLTVDPGPDVAPFHNRQVVVLSPEHAAAWLAGAPEADLLRPSPAGALQVERVEG